MPGSLHRTAELFPFRSLREILAKRELRVHAVAPQDNVGHAVQLMSANDIGLVVVLDGGHLAGVLSERDLVRAAGRGGAGTLRERQVSELMTREVIAVTADEQFGRCMELM